MEFSLTSTSFQISSSELDGPEIEAEEQAASGVPVRAVKKYFSAGASCCSLFFVVFVLLLSQVVTSGSDYFVNYWTQQEFKRSHGQQVSYTKEEYLGMYTVLILGVVFVGSIQSRFFVN